MAAPLNISIPPLKEDQRIEEWQPLFVAATSALVVTSTEKAAIQILPSFVCRNGYEQSTVLEAIKEETLEAAFALLRASLDLPIDQFEAMLSFRRMQWARGARIEVFFDQLRRQAKRAGQSNLAACTALVGELPEEVQPATKTWVKGKEQCTEKEAREFVMLVQATLRQRGFSLDHGARPVLSGETIRKTEETTSKTMDLDSEPEEGDTTKQTEVCKVWSAQRTDRERDNFRKDARTRFKCFTCGKLGHGWRLCPDRICGKCQKRGHSAFQCNVSSYQKEALRRPRRIYSVEEERRMNEESATITLTIDGSPTRVLLDTGAKINVMDVRSMRELGLGNKLIHTGGQVYGICSNPVTVKGYVKVSVKVPGERNKIECIQVLEGEEQAILMGRQFMHKFGRIAFDWQAGVVELGKAKIPICARAVGGDPLERAKTVKSSSEETKAPAQFREVINPRLSPRQGQSVRDLVNEHESVFDERPGRTETCEHQIFVGDAPPIKNRPRRLPPRWEEEINAQLDELLAQKLCRPSNSPWASNVVLVSKKDGKQRFTIDYRNLNDVTKKDAYSIPHIQTIFDKLHSYKFFSVIDITSAYWCVPVRECDIEKTAFNTPRGLYEMNVMPFGLVNSQATFQRLMDNTLKGLKRTESYIDDCIIFSRSFEEHIADLHDVLERLGRANIHVKFRKCQLGYREVEFLGHLISEGGRRPVPTAAERLAKIPSPKTVSELQRFLGSLNFYRSYIPKLAELAEPLYELTKKGEIWDWTQRREGAFRHLRAKLLEEPIVLAFPDWNTEFVVESDASSAAVAAVLSQRETDTGRLCPIDYFSSSLSQAQKNYSAGQLEAWGLVAACRKWRTYLRGADKVQLMTDHNPLRWMRAQRDPRHTFARWIMELEEYKYEIIYRPGKENVLPDYLSRIPDQNMDMDIQDEGIFEDKIFMVLQGDLRARVIQEQGRDPVTRAAIEQMRCGREIASGQLRRTASHLNLHEGVLYFDTRLVIPKAMQMEILNQVHTAGHFGQARTLQVLRRDCFWARMARDTKNHCRSCVTCQLAKPSNAAKQPLGTFDMNGIGPGDLVAMDVATLPWSDDTYRYFLCMVDVFTRYIEAVPLKDQKAQSLIRAFEDGWIYRGHGVPRALLTDQAHNVDGSEVRTLCDKLGIKK